MLLADAHLLWKTSRAHIGRFGAVTDGQRRRRHCIIGFSISFLSHFFVTGRLTSLSAVWAVALHAGTSKEEFNNPPPHNNNSLSAEVWAELAEAEVKEQWAILKLKETSKKKVSCQSASQLTPLAPGRSSLFHTKIGFFRACRVLSCPARRVWRNFHDLTLLA